MNEKLTKKQHKTLKTLIENQLKVLDLSSSSGNTKNFTLPIPKVEGLNVNKDNIKIILNEIFEPPVPEIISVQEFSCTETNSIVLFTLKKQ